MSRKKSEDPRTILGMPPETLAERKADSLIHQLRQEPECRKKVILTLALNHLEIEITNGLSQEEAIYFNTPLLKPMPFLRLHEPSFGLVQSFAINPPYIRYLETKERVLPQAKDILDSLPKLREELAISISHGLNEAMEIKFYLQMLGLEKLLAAPCPFIKEIDEYCLVTSLSLNPEFDKYMGSVGAS